MDPAILTASAAVLGSLAGASASLVTAWLNQRAQGRRASIHAEIHKRELLYAEFITECSKLVIDSLEHALERPQTLQPVYTLVNRIRLTSGDAVLDAAEAAMREIVAAYQAPNVPIEKIREMSLSEVHDPLRAFSEACRHELKSFQQDEI